MTGNMIDSRPNRNGTSNAWFPNANRTRPGLGYRQMHEIDRESVQVLRAALNATAKSHRTIVQTVAALRVMRPTALERARLTTEPAARLKPPTVLPASRRPSGAALRPINWGPWSPARARCARRLRGSPSVGTIRQLSSRNSPDLPT